MTGIVPKEPVYATSVHPLPGPLPPGVVVLTQEEVDKRTCPICRRLALVAAGFTPGAMYIPESRGHDTDGHHMEIARLLAWLADRDDRYLKIEQAFEMNANDPAQKRIDGQTVWRAVVDQLRLHREAVAKGEVRP